MKMNKRKQKKAYKEACRSEAYRDVRARLAEMKERYTVHSLPVERISPPGGIDETEPEDMDALCTSIIKHGLIEPLVVRRISMDNTSLGGLFLLISGRRRLLAVKKLGFRTVPCLIVDVRAEYAFETILSRKLCAPENDLFSAADALKRLFSEKYDSVDLYARALGTSAETVKRYVALASFSKEERALCRKYALPKELIFSIAALSSRGERKKALYECSACVGHLIATYAESSAQIRRCGGVLLSLLPVYNSIDRLTAQIRASGLPAYSEKLDAGKEYTVTVHIPKESAKIITAPLPLEKIKSGSANC